MESYFKRSLKDWKREWDREIQDLTKKENQSAVDKLFRHYKDISDSIQTSLKKRDCFFKNYQIISRNKKNIVIQPTRQSLFHLSFSLDRIPEESISCSSILTQLLTSFLALNTCIYEQCMCLCYHLLLDEGEINVTRCSDVLMLKNREKSQFDKDTDGKYETLTRSLRDQFGYHLAISITMRNRFIHGNIFNGEDQSYITQIFNFDENQLHLECINKMNQMILDTYNLNLEPISEIDFNNINIEIFLEHISLMSDSLFGNLIHHILKECFSE